MIFNVYLAWYGLKEWMAVIPSYELLAFLLYLLSDFLTIIIIILNLILPRLRRKFNIFLKIFSIQASIRI